MHRSSDRRGERFYVAGDAREEIAKRRGTRGKGGASGLSPESESERAPRERAFVPLVARDLGVEGREGCGGGEEIFVLSPCPVPTRCTFPRRRSEGAGARARACAHAISRPEKYDFRIINGAMAARSDEEMRPGMGDFPR